MSAVRYRLSAQQIRFFADNGFVVLRSVLSPNQINDLNARVSDVMATTHAIHRFAVPQDEYGRSFNRLMNVRQHDKAVEAFVIEADLAEIACRLLGVSGVRISHDTAFFKRPGAPETPVHADQYHWPVSSDRTVTAWIPLHDTALDQGPIAFYEKAHQLSESEREVLAQANQQDLKEYLTGRGFELSTQPFSIGDISFHLGWAFHCALSNQSNKTRKAFSIVYMDESIRLTNPRGKVALDIINRNWCPGCEVDSLISSPLNPVVFRSQGKSLESTP